MSMHQDAMKFGNILLKVASSMISFLNVIAYRNLRFIMCKEIRKVKPFKLCWRRNL